MVTCPYCHAAAVLVPDREVYARSYGGMVWLCKPCAAWVGCHKAGKGDLPLGRLANAELRALKVQAHAALDPLWNAAIRLRGWSKSKARGKAYKWLAEQLGIEGKDCHIGLFDEGQCKRVIELCARRAVGRTGEHEQNQH